VATLPPVLKCVNRERRHLVTVNDYLAKRDSTWKAPLFEFHGMTVDCIDNHPTVLTEEKHTILILHTEQITNLALIILEIT
jgi:preprotein translocase subunit SecA